MKSGLKKGLVSVAVIEVVVAAAIICCLVIIIFGSGCGGGGGGNSPLYDVPCTTCADNGANDNNPVGDQIANDTDADGMTKDNSGPFVCADPDTIPEICKKDMRAWCAGGYCTGGHFYTGGKNCTTDADCQDIPPDKYPPCVCWGVLPCTLAAWEWDCEESKNRTFVLEDGGDHQEPGLPEEPGFCYLGSYFFYNPITGTVQYPPEGTPEKKMTLLGDGSQFLYESPSGGTYTCSKVEANWMTAD